MEREPVLHRFRFESESMAMEPYETGRYCKHSDAWAKLVLLAKAVKHERSLEAVALADRILSAASQPPTTQKEGE